MVKPEIYDVRPDEVIRFHTFRYSKIAKTAGLTVSLLDLKVLSSLAMAGFRFSSLCHDSVLEMNFTNWNLIFKLFRYHRFVFLPCWWWFCRRERTRIWRQSLETNHVHLPGSNTRFVTPNIKHFICSLCAQKRFIVGATIGWIVLVVAVFHAMVSMQEGGNRGVCSA